jgi:hypothetical protein
MLEVSIPIDRQIGSVSEGELRVLLVDESFYRLIEEFRDADWAVENFDNYGDLPDGKTGDDLADELRLAAPRLAHKVAFPTAEPTEEWGEERTKGDETSG